MSEKTMETKKEETKEVTGTRPVVMEPPTATDVAPETKAAVKRTKTRTVEELKSIPVRKMSDNEKIKYIEHLEQKINLLTQQCKAFQDNATSAFTQFNRCKEDFEHTVAHINNRNNKIKKALEVFSDALEAYLS